MANTSIQINQGTQTPVAGDSVGGTLFQTVKLDMGVTGSSNPFTGTITASQSSNKPVLPVLTYGTLGTAGAQTFGTLLAAPGVGTAININDLSIVVYSGTVDCMIGFGTSLVGTTVVTRGQFVPGGGIEKVFELANSGGFTNLPLVFGLNGAGTAYFSVSYWNQ